MAEHHELVAEISALEQMGTQERQKLAKKRRLQQLKKWGQREKEWIAKEKQLNKRLASKLSEENNGLNLKQYTSYSSSHRSKKKPSLTSNANNNHQLLGNGRKLSAASIANNEFLNNNNNNSNFSSFQDVDLRLTPSGRVHFNVGVMLLEAAARNDFDEVKRLLILGVSPDSVNHDGLTALHQCCIDASEPMMNLLLEFGANVDARDTEQWTPLHAACTCGHLNLVKILVENGANLLAVNGDGNMPLDICEDEQTLDYIESQMVKRGITQEMIDYTRASTELQMIHDLEKQLADGKDLNASNENGVTQLHVAAANGYLSAVEFLLKNGVNVNVCDNDLWRPLHGAGCWGNEQHIKIVELLVEAGAHLDAKTINDETVFDLCDNAELLEKLNQLKDELESKQASGVGRLRRTQSRTNSRVHSVRRTSVRDKNQISRREAREEALLRVENSPIATTTVTNVDNKQVTTTDVSNNKKDSDSTETTSEKSSSETSPQLNEKKSNSNGINNNNDIDVKNNNVITNHSSALSNGKSESFNIDQVDSYQKNHVHNNNNHNTTVTSSVTIEKVTNSSPNRTIEHHQESRVKTGEDLSVSTVTTGNRSQNQDSSNDSISSKRKNLMKQAQVHSVSSNNLCSSVDTQTTSILNTIPTTISESSNNNPETLKENLHEVHSRSHSLAQDVKVRNGTTDTTLLTSKSASKLILNDRTNNNNNIAINDNLKVTHPRVADSFCDSNDLQRQQQMAQSLVQLAPINYTLSNLKKQRSDLRMRTTCIGGGGSVRQVELDPQSSLASESVNGIHHRPGSPGVTFRKFSGEPSEVIGDGNHNVGRKCCILI